MHIPKYRRTGSSSQAERTPASPAEDSPTPQRGSSSDLPSQARAAAPGEQAQRPRVAGLPGLTTEVWGKIAGHIDVQRRQARPTGPAANIQGGATNLIATWLRDNGPRMLEWHPIMEDMRLRGPSGMALAGSSTDSLDLSGGVTMTSVIQAAAKDPTTKRLNLSGNKIGLADAQALAANEAIEWLAVCGCELGVEGAQAVSQNTTFRFLAISENDIQDGGMQALIRNGRYAALDVSYNEIGDDGVYGIEENTSLRALDISGNSVEDPGAQSVARSRTLLEADLSDNLIGTVGAMALAANTVLTRLLLKSNYIDDAGAQAIAANEAFIEVDLSGNGPERDQGDEDDLSGGIAGSGASVDVFAQDTTMDDADAQAVADNEVFIDSDLSSNGSESDLVELEEDPLGGITNPKALVDVYAQNTVIKSLGLGDLEIYDDDIENIRNNRSLIKLGLANNNIANRGAIAVAAHPTLTDVDLRENCIEDEGAMALLANPRITSLDLSDNLLSLMAKEALEAARHRFKKLVY